MENLSATSALVQLWAGDICYQGKNARSYLEKLDLKSGKLLYRQCCGIWPHYGEVINNRKFGILHLIRKCLAEKDRCRQVVIAAAGIDPLGIELAEYFPEIAVFEFDRENMDVKEKLYRTSAVTVTADISFITTDILDTGVLTRDLARSGWNPQIPTLLVLEGISYYLPKQYIHRLISTFQPEKTIFEYLKESSAIDTDKNIIATDIFNLIADQCGLSCIERYSPCRVKSVSGMTILELYGMDVLEKMRSGTNTFFSTAASGWIEICLLGK